MGEVRPGAAAKGSGGPGKGDPHAAGEQLIAYSRPHGAW
jgi:hypothetical protein